MRKCKECGREEIGYGSIINKEGYCPYCAIRHNEEKVKELEQELKIRIDDNAELYAKLCNALVQLNEANDTILGMIGAGSVKADEIGKSYFKKWGVE